MPKISFYLVYVIIFSSCHKDMEPLPTNPIQIPPLPFVISDNFLNYPKSDTLFTNGNPGYKLKFVFRDYWGEYRTYGQLPFWEVEKMMLDIIKPVYNHIVPDSVVMDRQALSFYSIQLDIIPKNGDVIFPVVSKEFSFQRIKDHK